MVTKAEARAAARERAAAERAEAARRRRRNRRIVIAACVVGGLAVIGGGVFAIESGIASSKKTTSTVASAADRRAAATTADARITAPPWSLPTGVEAAVKSAGLTMLTSEGSVMHIHQHLSITVDGKAVTVPADLGIDETTDQLSALHTHDTTGILHVESPDVRTFHLDQAFAEWDVRLAKGALGSYVNGKDGVRLAVFVNQKPYTGDPREIVLKSKEDIDFVVTTDGSTPTAPAAFAWPSGY